VTLSVHRLEGPDALVELEPEWSALESTLTPYLPFRSPRWNRLWWTHFRRNDGRIRDEFVVRAVRDERHRLIAVAPLMRTKVTAGGMTVARYLQFFGLDPFVTERRGLVCRPEDQARVVAALRSDFARVAGSYDWIQWSGLETAERSDREPELRDRSELSDFFLPLPSTWDAFRTALPRNIKESLRKCYNSLKRDGHEFTFRVRSEEQEVQPAIERFLVLHARRAELRHSNVFASPSARAFIRKLAIEAARAGCVRVFQLQIAGHVVATRVGFTSADELYLYYSGYDLDWSRYSVMTTVTAEAIKWAIAQGLHIVNLSLGRDVSKTRWAPREMAFTAGVELAPSWRAPLAFHAYQELARLARADSVAQRLVSRVRATVRAAP